MFVGLGPSLTGCGKARSYPGASAFWDFANSEYMGAGGQVVSDPLALGAELVTNGDFASSLAGWTDASTAPSVWTWSGGQAVTSTDGSAAARLYQGVPTVAGRTYQVVSTGTAGLRVGSTTTGNDILAAAAASTRVFVAVGSTTYVNANLNTNGATLDNVSVREVLTGLQYSRTGAGTAEDSSGVYASFSANTPRRTNKGLLVEEARTNLTLSSLDYAGANWNKAGCSVGTLVAGPDGAVSASPITGNASGEVLRDQAAITVVSGSTYAVSRIVKRGNFDWLRVSVADTTGATNGVRAWFNLATGAVGSSSVQGTGWSHASAATVQALGGGFYRCTLFVTTGAATLYTFVSSAAADASTNRADVGSGAGVGTTYTLHNSDVTLGAFACSPILTTGAAGTRGADSGLISLPALPAQFTVFVEAKLDVSNDGVIRRTAALTDGTANNRVSLSRDASNNSAPAVTVGGVNSFPTAISGYSGTPTMKQAMTYDGTNYRFSATGAAVTTAAGSALTVLNRLDLGTQLGSNPLNGWVRKVVIYPRTFTDAELQALTA